MIHHYILIVLLTIIWAPDGTATMDAHEFKTKAACVKAQATFETAQTLEETLAPFGLKERHYSRCEVYFDKREDTE
jgi:hypothetical protein